MGDRTFLPGSRDGAMLVYESLHLRVNLASRVLFGYQNPSDCLCAVVTDLLVREGQVFDVSRSMRPCPVKSDSNQHVLCISHTCKLPVLVTVEDCGSLSSSNTGFRPANTSSSEKGVEFENETRLPLSLGGRETREGFCVRQ